MGNFDERQWGISASAINALSVRLSVLGRSVPITQPRSTKPPDSGPAAGQKVLKKVSPVAGVGAPTCVGGPPRLEEHNMSTTHNPRPTTHLARARKLLCSQTTDIPRARCCGGPPIKADAAW